MVGVIAIVIIFFSLNLLLINGGMMRNYYSYVVQSGSMEPTIMTGDIIFVSHQDQYHKNDVITFKEGDSRIITHRVVDDRNFQLTTKGDANRIEDNSSVSLSHVIGKVFFTVPKLGYLVFFSKTQIGFLIFIIIPSLLLMGIGVHSLSRKHEN